MRYNILKKQQNIIIQFKNMHTIIHILDFECSKGSNDLTMVFIYLFIFYPVYKMSTRRSASISTYRTLSLSKLDQDDILKRSFLDFHNSYLMPQEKPSTTEKLQKTAKNGILISNALFITIETNKNKKN